MTYQFKYMDAPTQKAERGGAGFKGIKLAIELCLTVFALMLLYNFYAERAGGQTPNNQAVASLQNVGNMQALLNQTNSDNAANPASASLAGAQAILEQGGAAPTQEMLAKAQNMAETFMTSGDLSEFDQYANSGNIGLDY